MKVKVGKNEVYAVGRNYSLSQKHAAAVCKFIKGRTIPEAIALLERVQSKRTAVPMKGEIPHRKGNIERGRYPVKASYYIIKLLKSLRGNAAAKSLDEDSLVIRVAKADRGETPMRIGRMGRRGKSTHITLVGEGHEVARKEKKPIAKEKEKHEHKTAEEEVKEMREKPVHTKAEELEAKEISHETHEMVGSGGILKRKEKEIREG
ncbi:MAG TPA: hypothetical protein HA282_01980 [Nanoarchaeota archaeon]|nr:large subunit ribosomal protein L22 [uncultured archaeon]KHO48860.1 MAG: large subunit ribosomal protein L22 [archaeon GW2011_AR6]HIH18085.1 hypothetical protein [Nanoarchaeota archaeon]HIH50929.1 hypothetical protein [Nanoarchaeota archaeon]HIH65965.1 hypothetical protein [Nanoarchaeota archaeon]